MSRAFLLAGLLACGCAAVPIEKLEAEADRLRDAAMRDYEAGDCRSALALNEKALEVTRRLSATSWRTVENYDDAGLYYYATGDWEQSARHQSIAVLLACRTAENAAMFTDYVERLGMAFAKYRPRQDFASIARDPLVLLDDPVLGLRGNPDVQRRFFLDFSCY
jgi:hypothetical protein